MVDQVRQREAELTAMEERSRQMLIEAQKDAHECIEYFKEVALRA